MKYKVTSDSVLFTDGKMVFNRDNYEEIFKTAVDIVCLTFNYNSIPIPTDMVIKNGTDKIVFTYSYPINSDPVSIVFNIEKIE